MLQENKKCPHRIIGLVLIIALLLPLAGCAAKHHEIDWELYGTWVTESGELGEETTFSFSAELPSEVHTKVEVVDINIDLPDDFRYEIFTDDTQFSCYTCPNESDPSSLYHVLHGYMFDPEQNLPMLVTLVLCPETGYMLVTHIGSEPESYLMASTDPDADPTEIMDYFSSILPSGMNGWPWIS